MFAHSVFYCKFTEVQVSSLRLKSEVKGKASLTKRCFRLAGLMHFIIPEMNNPNIAMSENYFCLHS